MFFFPLSSFFLLLLLLFLLFIRLGGEIWFECLHTMQTGTHACNIYSSSFPQCVGHFSWLNFVWTWSLFVFIWMHTAHKTWNDTPHARAHNKCKHRFRFHYPYDIRLNTHTSQSCLFVFLAFGVNFIGQRQFHNFNNKRGKTIVVFFPPHSLLIKMAHGAHSNAMMNFPIEIIHWARHQLPWRWRRIP